MNSQRIRMGIAAAAFAWMAACSSVNVNTDHDPRADFSKYKTYEWVSLKPKDVRAFDPQGRNDLLDRRVKAAVDSNLAKKGLKEEATHPDLRVIYYAKAQNKMSVSNWGVGYGYGYGPWSGYLGPGDVYEYREGSLIVDFIDNKTNELVWRGVATETVDTTAIIDQQQVNEAVAKMMQEYPPKKETA